MTVATLLGLRVAKRSRDQVTIFCPSHLEKHGSCSLTRAKDGALRARCFSCNWSGDVFGLVAEVRGLDPRHAFAAVVREAAELAGVEPDAGHRDPHQEAATVSDVVRLAHRFACVTADFLEVGRSATTT